MARKQNRYRVMERYVTIALAADLLCFVLFLIFSGFGITWAKITSGILTLLISISIIAFLYYTKELLKIRSLWMSAAAAGIVLCTLTSLMLSFPRPKPTYKVQYENESTVDTNSADDDYNKDGYVIPFIPDKS